MGNTINFIILYTCISLILYAGQIAVVGKGYFGSDIISDWVELNPDGTISDQYNSSLVDISNSTFNNPSTTEGLTGTVLLNFWDLTQIVWKFIVLIFNIVFVIPLSLLKLQIPNAIKLGFVIPFIIVGFSVFIFGIFGRR